MLAAQRPLHRVKNINDWFFEKSCSPQIAIAPLRKQPPDWAAFDAEKAALLLRRVSRAVGMNSFGHLHSRLQDAGRALLAASRAKGAPSLYHMTLPEPAAAIDTVKGEAHLQACWRLGLGLANPDPNPLLTLLLLPSLPLPLTLPSPYAWL